MLEPGERKKAHRLVARTINEAGGILGRRVVPLFFEFSSTDYSTYEELWRSACSYFTEEHEVLAILGVRGSETLAPCMEAADAIHVVPPMKDVDLETYRRYPHSIGPTNMSLDRIAEHYVQALDARNL